MRICFKVSNALFRMVDDCGDEYCLIIVRVNDEQFEDGLYIQKYVCLIHFRQGLDKKTCFSGIVQSDFMKLQFYWPVLFAGSRN